MSVYEKRLIYIFLVLIIVVSAVFIHKINKSERELYNEIYTESKEILDDINSKNEVSISKEKENPTKVEIKENKESIETKRMTTGKVTAFLRITKLDLFYPVVERTTMESMKVTLTKLWGNEPNAIGNFCIIGHNLRSDDLFGNLNKLKIGDSAELMEKSGNTVKYKVYKIYTVADNDLSFSSQLTNGKREITLITCTNDSKRRLIIKCEEA